MCRFSQVQPDKEWQAKWGAAHSRYMPYLASTVITRQWVPGTTHNRKSALQVDDCIAKYLWMQNMVQKMAERKKQGLPMPTSIAEVEDQLGMVPGAALPTILVKCGATPAFTAITARKRCLGCASSLADEESAAVQGLGSGIDKNIQTWRRQLPQVCQSGHCCQAHHSQHALCYAPNLLADSESPCICYASGDLTQGFVWCNRVNIGGPWHSGAQDKEALPAGQHLCQPKYEVSADPAAVQAVLWEVGEAADCRVQAPS